MLLLLTVLALLKPSYSITTNNTQDNVEGIFPYSLNELHTLSELPLDKLIRLKNTISNEIGSTSTPEIEISTSRVERVGDSKVPQQKSEAMALSGIPPRRSEHEYSGQLNKKDSKVNKVFTLSVTTLAFLAFGGYLLCLIVQAVKHKSNYIQNLGVPTQSTIVLSSLKKKPQLLQYGRKRRDVEDTGILDVSGNSENLYSALVSFCEGYAKWSGAVSKQ